VEPTPCAADGDCLGARVCVVGECDAPCQADLDCPQGWVCDGGSCHARCAGDQDCPGAQTCDDHDGHCREAVVCGADEDCLDPRVCDGGACHEPCLLAADCPGSQACTAESGHCSEPVSCATDMDCLGLRVCDGGLCRAGCAGDGDCGGMLVCDQGSGHCQESGVCGADADCAGARVCDGGACHAPCVVHADCPEGRLCAPETGHCPVPQACDEDDDCGAGLVCDLVSELCREPALCQGEVDCPEDDCPGGLVHVPMIGTRQFLGSTLPATDLHAGTCGGDGAPEVVYEFRLDGQATTVDLEVDAEFAPVMHLRGAECGGEELACVVGSSLQINLEPRTYHLIVDGDGQGARGDFTLGVDTMIMPDTCFRAASIQFEPPLVPGCCIGRAELRNDTTQSTSDFSDDAACGAGSELGKDLFYRFDVAEAVGLEVTLDAGFDAVVALLAGDDCDDLSTVDCGQELDVPVLQPGTYYLVVDGLGAEEQGPFGMTAKLVE